MKKEYKEKIIGAAVWGLCMMFVLIPIWGVGTFFADTISTHEVIKPRDGVECVVVSRMFNTSVDCWKD